MAQASPGRRALVVDDDELVQDFVRAVLEGQDFEVYVADDGKTATSIYEKHPDFSLVVTDILMPNADGIALILKIRQTAGTTQPKIIAISGGGFIKAEEYLENARELGADVTLAKPFSTLDLLNALSGLGFGST